MRSLPATAAVLAVILILMGVRELVRKKAPSPENGRLIGQLYTNSVFGFTVRVPTNLPVWNRAALEKGIHKNLPRPRHVRAPLSFKSIEIPDAQIHSLLTISEAPVDLTDNPWIGVLGPTNTSFIILAQNMSWYPDAKDGRTVLEFWHSILNRPRIAPYHERAPGDLESAGPSAVSIGGRTFYRDTFRLKQLTHRFYACIENGYALQFILVAPTDADLEKLEQIVATTHFN